MEPLTVLWVVLVMVLGGFIQSSSGFGFGLFAVPLFLLFGFTLPDTVIMVVIASAIQKMAAVYSLRRSVDWRGHAPFMLTGLAALPLGVLGLYRASLLDPETLRPLVGGLVLVLLLLQWRGVIRSREKVPAVWGYLAGFFSGLLNGLANIGGPPLVLWVLAHRWDNNRMRVTPIAFSLVFVPFQVGFMAMAFGDRMWTPLLVAVLLSPSVLLGTGVGLAAGRRLSRIHLRTYMRLLLLGIAVVSILRPLL